MTRSRTSIDHEFPLRRPGSWLAVFPLVPVAATIIALVVSLGVSVSPAMAQSDDEEDSLLVSEARAAVQGQDFDRAADLLDRALQLNPRRITTYVLRATVHDQKKEYAAGVAMMRRAEALAPDNPAVLVTLGTLLMHNGQTGEAVPILERVASTWRDRYQAHQELAAHFAATQQWDKAITSYEAYLDTRPEELRSDDTRRRLELANAYLRSGNPEKAQGIYRGVVDGDKDNVLGRLGLAWATAAIDCREALPMLRDDLAALVETYPVILVVHARCSLLTGDIQQALSLAESYQERQNTPKAWALVAEARVANGDYKGAMAAMTQAAELDKNNRTYVLELARIERLAGEPEKAIARLRATEPPPGSESAWTIELGQSLSAAGEYAEVRQTFSAFVEQNPESAAGYTLLGVAVHELGEAEVAIEHLERSLKLDAGQKGARPTLIKAYNTVAVQAFAATDLEKAEVNLVRAEAIGDSAMTWRNLGALRLIAGKAPSAVEPLKKAAGAAPDDPIAHHLLGRAYHATSDHQGALKLFARAISLTPARDREMRTNIALDQAAAMNAIGDGNTALDLLDGAMKIAVSDDQRTQVSDALIVVARRQATTDMSNGNFARAYKSLSSVVSGLPQSVNQTARDEIECDLALAATGASMRRPALRLLQRLEKGKVKCPFVAPANEVAIQILIAWNEGATARSAKKALKRLNSLRKRATGPAAPLVRTAARDIAIRAAIEAHKRGKTKKARQFLETARRYDPQGYDIDHNIAVLDIQAGRVDKAIQVLERTQSTVPEALINLAIAYERKAQPQKALQYYRRAVSAGVRANTVKEWLERKERLWGSQGGAR